MDKQTPTQKDKLKIYHNNEITLGFTRKFRGYNNVWEKVNLNGQLKGDIGINPSLLIRALKKMKGIVNLEIRQHNGYSKALFINDGIKSAMIGEYILPVKWKIK